MIKRVFLDLDDTILDFRSAERKAISIALMLDGIIPTDEIVSKYSEINLSQWKLLEKGELSSVYEVKRRRFEVLFDYLGMPVPPSLPAHYESELSNGHDFIDGAEETLNELYGRYSLYLVSNGLASVQAKRLADADLYRFFDGIFISERIGSNKPEKEFFDAVFSSISSFSLDEAVIVGDSLTSDIKGGKNAGIKTIWLNRDGKENNSGIIPDVEISDIRDLVAVLATL